MIRILLCLSTTLQANLPVVLWHGMGDNCCHTFSMGSIEKLIQDNAPSVGYVKSLMVGSSPSSDTTNGFLMPVNDQVDMVCKMIADDEKLKDGYNAIGFSQGAQFLRGVAQKCPNPPMKNLISIGGQHQGIYGFPKCPGDYTICHYVSKLLDYGAYTNFVQSHITQAQYWHDPMNENTYSQYSQYLARINCEQDICPREYRTNLKNLEHFVMVKFNQDTMIVPKESSQFGFYAPGQLDEIYNMTESLIFTEDRIGLKEMYNDGKIVLLDTDGDHLRFTEEFFITEIVPYLE